MPLLGGGELENLRGKGGSLVARKAGEVTRNIQCSCVIGEHAPDQRGYVLRPLHLICQYVIKDYIIITSLELHHHRPTVIQSFTECSGQAA